MTETENSSLKYSVTQNRPIHRRRLLIFILQTSLVVVLLLCWFGISGLQESKNLWVLFWYSFPSQFLIAVVPHEPVFFYFSKFYAPWLVTIVAIWGTLMTEFLNYSVFRFVADYKNISCNQFVARIVRLFERAPFLALLIAGFTPIPFYPLRFLVVLAEYPRFKYLLAVFLSRTPRFYLFALVGKSLNMPNWLLLAIFVVLIFVANFPLMKNFIQGRMKKRTGSIAEF